jgi:hypothetical protein
MNFEKNDYDVIILAGQSNAEGYGRGEVSEEYLPDEDIISLTPSFTSVYKVENGVDSLSVVYHDEPLKFAVADVRIDKEQVTNSLSLTFSEEYKKNGYLKNGRKLLIINAAIGATGFENNYWGLGKMLYNKMTDMVDYVLSLNSENRIVAFLWHQGEHDAGYRHSPTIFKAQFKEMLDAFKERYNIPEMPIVAGDFVNEWKSANIEQCAPIIDAIKTVIESENGIFVETFDLMSNNQKNGDGDTIHFCRESLHILGRRYFYAFKRIIER